jgi:hypothetical protein
LGDDEDINVPTVVFGGFGNGVGGGGKGVLGMFYQRK